MPISQTVYRCMIISPSDVGDARDAIEETITAWNAQIGPGLQARVDPVRWESHSRPEMGGKPQEIINRQLVDNCDFGVALFWSRLGSPTDKHESGSVEEIYGLLERNSGVMVYFCEAPIPQQALRDDQYQRLLEVKKRFVNEGLLGRYTTLDDLKRTFNLHLTALMTELLLAHKAPGQPIPSSGTVTAPTPDIQVKAKAAFAKQGNGPLIHLLSVTVENHSPANFFLSSVVFELTDGSNLYVQRDVMTGEYNNSRVIEPGDSYDFRVDPGDLEQTAKGRAIICALASDKIGRCFRSDPGHFKIAMNNTKVLQGQMAT